MKWYSLTILFCLLATPFFVVSGQESAGFTTNETGVGANDTSLIEIFLSNEGVVAYDTLGNSWVYDFRSDAFVLSDEPIASPSGLRTEDAIQPVEERCTEEKRLRDWQNEVSVRYDEYVDGSIHAYGDIDIRGWVIGDIRSTAGIVTIYESGQVDGDVKAPEIIVRDGGIVSGRQLLTEPLDLPVELITDRFRTEGIWVVFGFTIFFLLSGFLLTSLAPKQIGMVENCINCCSARSLGLGFLFVFLAPVLMALVAVTVVGLVLVPLIPIAYLLAICIAMIVVGRKLDLAISREYFPGKRSLPFQGLFGILVFMLLWTLVAILLGSSSSVANGMGIFILVVAILATSAAFLVGTGAVVLTRFGFREYVPAAATSRTVSDDAPAPAPPPLRSDPPADIPTPPSLETGPLSLPNGPVSPDADDRTDSES